MKTKRSPNVFAPGPSIHERAMRLIGILSAMVLAGCTTPPSPAPSTSAAHQKTAAHSVQVQELQKRLDRLLEPSAYRYSHVGKTDPFQTFLRSNLTSPIGTGGTLEEHPPERCETALECLDVGQLKLVAIVKRGNGSYIAMAQDASGIGYILTPGTKVGYRKGTVSEIREDRLVVREESEDIRGGSIRERQLLLHPEEQR
ncbi:MAG: pilus assembly protein PilP [Deltaproteobacteria bacterium]